MLIKLVRIKSEHKLIIWLATIRYTSNCVNNNIYTNKVEWAKGKTNKTSPYSHF